MKPKLVLISGLTAVGKSEIAYTLAKRLNTEIIVGDSLQIYKNYPVSSNFPEVRDVKYNLLGQVDVYNTRVIAPDYKDLVINETSRLTGEGKIPIIEGGNGFYLNYLLTSTGMMYGQARWDKAIEDMKVLEREIKTNEGLIAKLKELCPHYDDSIQPNDFYRLEKALRYALASDGKTFHHREGENDRLKDAYDVRGFFVTMKQETLKYSIDKRCYKMTLNGMIPEFMDYFLNGEGQKMKYTDRPVPIGYEELARLVIGLIRLRDNPYIDEVQNQQKVFNLCKDFIADFQTKSRQYAAYQRKYFRAKFKYFSWKEVYPEPRSLNKVTEEIYEEIMMSEEEYKSRAESPENEKVIFAKSDEKKCKKLVAYFNLKSMNELTLAVTNHIQPKIDHLKKLKVFENYQNFTGLGSGDTEGKGAASSKELE